MSVDAESGDGEFATVGPSDATYEGCRSITLESGDVVLYAERDEDAWIQSDDYVDASLML